MYVAEVRHMLQQLSLTVPLSQCRCNVVVAQFHSLFLQAAASTTSPSTGVPPLYPGTGGLPDLSSLFGASPAPPVGTGGAGGAGLGALGLGSGNFAEMQQQVGWSFQSVLPVVFTHTFLNTCRQTQPFCGPEEVFKDQTLKVIKERFLLLRI